MVKQKVEHAAWVTEEDYDAQVALPVHLVLPDLKMGTDLKGAGAPVGYFATRCGKRLGSELLRTTDDAAEVTCEACR